MKIVQFFLFAILFVFSLNVWSSAKQTSTVPGSVTFQAVTSVTW
jgi:hypothetical protein